MIITAPLRRMILQRSQRGFTEVRIFMSFSSGQAALQSLRIILRLRLRMGRLNGSTDLHGVNPMKGPRVVAHSATNRPKAANRFTLPHRRSDLPLNFRGDRLDVL